jgi:hypothetical protein
MAESYFGIHLGMLTTFSGTVGGQIRQVLLYLDECFQSINTFGILNRVVILTK